MSAFRLMKEYISEYFRLFQNGEEAIKPKIPSTTRPTTEFARTRLPISDPASTSIYCKNGLEMLDTHSHHWKRQSKCDQMQCAGRPLEIRPDTTHLLKNGGAVLNAEN
jgi:hypothetical protein